METKSTQKHSTEWKNAKTLVELDGNRWNLIERKDLATTQPTKMGLSHIWETEETQKYPTNIGNETSKEEQRLTEYYNECIQKDQKYANRSPIEWAEQFLHGIAIEPWTTHDQQTVFTKYQNKVRELKAGHTVVGPIFTANKRGSLAKISTLEMGANNFKAAVSAIKKVQQERQHNFGRARHDYCDAVKAQDHAVMEFVWERETIGQEWKEADAKIAKNERSQNQDQLDETFCLICIQEAKWIREEVGKGHAQ